MVKILFEEMSQKKLKKQADKNTFNKNSKDSGTITQESIRKTMEGFFNHKECKNALNIIRANTDPVD